MSLPLPNQHLPFKDHLVGPQSERENGTLMEIVRIGRWSVYRRAVLRGGKECGLQSGDGWRRYCDDMRWVEIEWHGRRLDWVCDTDHRQREIKHIVKYWSSKVIEYWSDKIFVFSVRNSVVAAAYEVEIRSAAASFAWSVHMSKRTNEMPCFKVSGSFPWYSNLCPEFQRYSR